MAVSVKFTYIEQNKLDTVPIVTGQIIALTDAPGYYYDWNGVRNLVNAEYASNGTFAVASLAASSASAALQVDLAEIAELTPGTCLYVINNRLDIAGSTSLQVNNLGSKPVYNSRSGNRTVVYPRNSGALFIYNEIHGVSGSWDIVTDVVSNAMLGNVTAYCAVDPVSDTYTADTTQIGFNLVDGAIVTVVFDVDVQSSSSLAIAFQGGATATSCPMMYMGNEIQSGIITAGSTAVFRFIQNDDQESRVPGEYQLLAVDSVIELAKDASEGAFWCTYDVTTYAEISNAVTQNKLCLLAYGADTYMLTYATRMMYYFTSLRYPDVSTVTCKSLGNVWAGPTVVELASKAEVDEKYTMPEDGIPMEDLAFFPAVVDPTFSDPDEIAAAPSETTGARFTQLETMARRNQYTDVIVPTFSYQAQGINSSTGNYAPSHENECSTYPVAYSSDLLFTLEMTGSYSYAPYMYEWCIWAYSNNTVTGAGTHSACMGGFVNATCPLLLKHDSGDEFYVIAWHRVDEGAMDATECSYLLSSISVRSYSASSSTATGYGLTTARSNSTLVNQIVSVASSYWNNRAQRRMDDSLYMQSSVNETTPYTILDPEFEQLNPLIDDTNYIDGATFVGLVLRGIVCTSTYYYLYDQMVPQPPSYWAANPSYVWSSNPAYYQVPPTAGSVPTDVRTAAQLGEWMVRQGRSVPIDTKLANLEVGDIVFFARTDYSGNWKNPNGYMHISDVGICDQKLSRSNDPNGCMYTHKILMVTPQPNASTICFSRSDAEWIPTSTSTPIYYNVGYHSLCLICRPDLGSITG